MPPIEKGQEYTCSGCGGTFVSEWSDAEAMAELEATLVPMPGPLIVVCDDCYKYVIDRVRAEEPELLK